MKKVLMLFLMILFCAVPVTAEDSPAAQLAELELVTLQNA